MSEKERRERLPGSEELFRNTRAEAEKAAREGRSLEGRADAPPTEPVTDTLAVELEPEEIRSIVEALQLARFPELHRQRPTIGQFERLGLLQERLRSLLGDA